MHHVLRNNMIKSLIKYFYFSQRHDRIRNGNSWKVFMALITSLMYIYNACKIIPFRIIITYSLTVFYCRMQYFFPFHNSLRIIISLFWQLFSNYNITWLASHSLTSHWMTATGKSPSDLIPTSFCDWKSNYVMKNSEPSNKNHKTTGCLRINVWRHLMIRNEIMVIVIS